MITHFSNGRVLAVLLTICFGGFTAPALAESDARLHGTWRTVSYTVQGTVHEMNGLMIITPDYFMANTTFDIDGDGRVDGNANSGPYRTRDGKIVLTHWMQLHWRPADADGNFLSVGDVEAIPYRLEDGKLIFAFPSGNFYTSERLE